MPAQQSRTQLRFGTTRGVRSELKHSPGGGAESEVNYQIDGRLISDVAGVNIIEDAVSIAADAKHQLRANAVDANGKTVEVTSMGAWSSASEAVVTVDGSGVITGVATGGPTNVSFTFEGETDTCAVTVG